MIERILYSALLLLLPLACTHVPPPVEPAPVADAATFKNPPQHLLPLKEGVWSYQVTDGDGKDASVTQVVKFDPSDPAAPWRRIFSANNVIAHLRQDPDGSIVMPANEIVNRDVTNVFSPPQVVLPAPAAMTAPVRVTSKVVTSLRSRPKIKVDQGEAELSLTPGGAETIETPAGTFVCQRIDLKLNLKFGLGQVESVARLHYADNVGLVAETYYEKATVFFVTSTKTRKMVLKSYPR